MVLVRGWGVGDKWCMISHNFKDLYIVSINHIWNMHYLYLSYKKYLKFYYLCIINDEFLLFSSEMK